MKKTNIYLIAYYFTKPKDPQKTKDKGYMSNPENYIYDESINITRGLKHKDERTAKVILDLSNQTVIRNNFNDNKDFASLLSYYQEGYPKYLNPLISQLYIGQHDASDVPKEETEKRN